MKPISCQTSSSEKQALKRLFTQISNGESVETIVTTLEENLKLGIGINAEIPAKIPNSGESYGLRAITVAAECDRLDIVKLILDRGAEASCSVNDDGYGYAPINAATRNCNLEMVQLFIDREVDLDSLCNIDGGYYTPLQIAACYQNYDSAMVQILVKGGADITSPNTEQRTILNYAVERNDVETVQIILDELTEIGDEVKSEIIGRLDMNGDSPFHTAVISDNPIITRILLDNGADVNAPCGDGGGNDHYTPIYMAAVEGAVNVIDLLLDRGAEINLQNEEEESLVRIILQALQRESRFSDTSFLPHLDDEEVQNKLSLREGVFLAAAISNAENNLPDFLANFSRERAQEVNQLKNIKNVAGIEYLTIAQQNKAMAGISGMLADNRKSSTFLAVILPEGELRNSVINHFNNFEENSDSPLNQEKISKLREYKDKLVAKLIRSTASSKIETANAVIDTLLTENNLELAREHIIQNYSLNKTEISFLITSVNSSDEEIVISRSLPSEISGMAIMPYLNELPNPLKEYPPEALEVLRSIILKNAITPQDAQPSSQEPTKKDLSDVYDLLMEDDLLDSESTNVGSESTSLHSSNITFTSKKRSLSEGDQDDENKSKELKPSPSSAEAISLTQKQMSNLK